MRIHNLTAYDATYMDLAMRRGLPLPSHDRASRKAATLAGLALLASGVPLLPLSS
jgi:predicted nucleic acid-binding protein